MAQPLPPRDYLIEEYTRAVCPACFAERARRADDPAVMKDGMLVTRNGAVYLRRACATHGETESLYEEDAAIWRARRGWSTPTLVVTPDRPGNFGPFPAGYRDGLPVAHGQHSCVLLLNLCRCPRGRTDLTRPTTAGARGSNGNGPAPIPLLVY